jgi:hypothetical protein
MRALSALLLLAGVSALIWYPSAARSRAGEVTISAGNLRDGWDSAETGTSLLPATVKGGTFGEIFSTYVDGQVYAQPISVGNTLIVATENDWVYGLNATTGAVQWSTSLGVPWPSSAEHCTDLAPNVGVTGTPVYDPAIGPNTPDGAVYMVAEEVPSGHTASNPVFYMHALNPQSGDEVKGFPVPITGAPANNPTEPFAPFNQLQRPGLLLLGGSVYAAFGSHCDFQPYDGYVVGVAGANAGAPGSQTMWSDEAGVADYEAGIWQSGGGLMSDGDGRMFFASGNGVSPAPGPGSKPPANLAESVVRLAVLKDGSLAARDFFSPSNAPYLDSIDGDLGAGGPVGLPFGTATLPDLMVEAGKVDGLFVLNRNKLGGRSQGSKGADAVVSETGKSLPGEWGHPAAFATTPVLSTANVTQSRDYLYYLGTGQSNAGAPLQYFKAGLGGSNGSTPVLTDVAQSSDRFGFTSGSPVVTSNGNTASTGVVWLVNSSGESGATGTLQAFPVVPPGKCSAAKPCTVSPIWTSPVFDGAGKFTTPATSDGRVYVATRGVLSTGSNCPTGTSGSIQSGDYCGQVIGYGSPSKVPLTASGYTPFGNVAVGSSSAPQDVTVTNSSSGAITIESEPTVTGQFGAAGTYELGDPVNGLSAVSSFPQALQPGQWLTVQGVSFNPTAPGGASGSVELSTSSANFPSIGVPLSGIGTQLGFYGSASSVDFGSVPVGTTTQEQLTVTNGESIPVTWTTTQSPASPFSVTGLPADDTTVQPGQGVLLTVSYTPTGTSGDSDSLVLTADDQSVQTPTTIPLTGTGVADVEPTDVATPPAPVTFGSVPLGHNVQRVIDIANDGNLPATISATSPPSIPFGAPDPIAPGLPVNPGYDLQIPVTFSPSSAGSVSDTYQLTWNDVNGSHVISVPVTGTGVAVPPNSVAVPPPGGGWTFNGSAKMLGTRLSLTQLTRNQAGSAVYSEPVPSNGLNASIKVHLGGGTGGNGMTFALLDASSEGQRAVGGGGPELGFGGLNGVAVAVDTSQNSATYAPAGYVGIATGAAGGVLTFAKTANVAGLRTGTHTLGVSTSGSTVTVSVDGKPVLSTAVTLPPTVRLALTAATGGVHIDNHMVTGATITSAGNSIPAPGGGWSYNGVATTSGSDTRLTPAQPNLAGAVVYSVPVKAIGLRAVFDVQIGGGTGGDGMTFALLDPAKTSIRTVGGLGVMLGLGTSFGVPGLGIALATDGAQSPAGFVGTSVRAATSGLKFQRKAQGIGMLTTGTHVVAVVVTKGSPGALVTISLDGVQVLQVNEPTLSSQVRLAFTAGTGVTTDVHIVRNVAISANG